MSTPEYDWQREAWHLAHAAIERGAHALLIAGAHGVGKREFALKLAAGRLCAAGAQVSAPCGSCDSCHWFLAGTHPDFLLVEPIRDEPETEAVPSPAGT